NNNQNKSILGFIQTLTGIKLGGKNQQGLPTVNGKSVNSAEAQALTREQKIIQKFAQGLVDVKDIIAPSAIEVNFNNLVIGNKYFRSYFAIGFPSVVTPNWLEPIINFEYPIDLSTYYYPFDTGEILKVLKRKIAEFQATINIEIDRKSTRLNSSHVKISYAVF